MHHCMVAYSFYESDSRIQQYARALVERNDQVDVIALSRNAEVSEELIDGVTLYRIQSRERNERSAFTYLIRTMLFLVRAAWVLGKLHFRRRYNIIHVHNVPDFLVFTAIVPKIAGIPVILDIHDILPELYAGKFKTGTWSAFFKAMVLVERISIAFADHVIIANHLWYDRLISRSVTADKCTAICNYPDPSLYFPRRQRADGRFVVMYPGTLSWFQGLDIAIRAFAKVAVQEPTSEFWIHGEGPEKDNLINLTRELGLTDKVLFKGWLPTKEIAEAMAESDLALVPKRAGSFANEAASTKIMEFMALGVPVIVSRTKIDTFYHDDTRVKFFESEDVDGLTEAILLLIRDRSLREALARNALIYMETHNWRTRREEYLHLVDSLAAKRRPIAGDVQISAER